MPAAIRFLWIVPFAALSTAAPGQTTGAIGSPTTGSASEIRGPGLPVVPNNSLAPLPGSTVPSLGAATPGLSTTTPGLTTTIPGLTTTTPGGVSTTTPGATTSTTPGVIIELPPPTSGAASTSGGTEAVRTCPPGITFC
jgi:hypothetical protein